jgi:hypothetical protein
MWNELKVLLGNGSKALNAGALFNAGLFCICLGLSFIDERSIMGVNPWLKPMKFSLSVMIYCLTLSMILALVDGFDKLRLWLGRAVAALMYVEMAAITIQAARGVTSHYNIATALDAGIFSAMGLAIGLNTVLDSVVFGLMILVPVATLPTGVLWGIRFGLMMFIAAGFEGGMMIMNQAHTVGAPDGGAGIPWANWSREHGDLRVAHFIGLHALQILPVFGLLVDRILKPDLWRAIAVSAAAGGLGWLMWMQTRLATSGQPFFRF